jgi:hypothetical protein
MKILRRANDLFDQIVEESAPRERNTFTVTVAVDPTWHGFDLSDAEKRDIVLAAINARPGLEVLTPAEVTR